MLYQLSAGQGPAECELGVSKLLSYFKNHYDISVTDVSPGQHKDTFRSVRFTSEDNLSDYLGSIKWIRPHHKRKNWFIDFSICVTSASQKFNPDQVMFETFRSSGKV